MTTPPNNLLQPQTPPANRKTPLERARSVGEYAQALALLMLWILVSTASVAFAYLGIRLVLYALDAALHALGLD